MSSLVINKFCLF